MAYDFNVLMADINSNGIGNVLLPFLLIFAIVYAVLEKVRVFEKKSVNVIIAFVMGFLVATNTAVVNVIQESLPNVSLAMVGILMILLLIGIFGYRFDIGAGRVGGLVAMIAFLAVITIFMKAAGVGIPDLPAPLDGLNSPETQAMVIVIGVFVLLIWYITKEDKPSQIGGGVGRIMDEFKNMLQR